MGVNKPSMEYFDLVLETIKEPKESCLVIGDSLSSDMLGAQNASMPSVWFRPDGDIEQARKKYDIDYTAASFEELFQVIRKWSIDISV
jgi:FMN phosphatase YigB (HAD superfamily)